MQLPVFARDIAVSAAGKAFGNIEIMEAASLGEIENTASAGTPVFLIIHSTATELTGVLNACSPSGEPRWAIAVLGAHSKKGIETLLPEEWPPQLLACVFRRIFEQHELRCENLRLRGDLRTVGRRISHDLRSPIGSVYTSTDVLSEISATDAETSRELAATIKESVSEILQLVNQVSFVSLASTDTVTPSRVDMGALVADVLQRLDQKVQETGATIVVPSTWPDVVGVANWLVVVWTNLVENALQHAGPNPKIQFSWTAMPKSFRFILSDNGPGVPATRVADLFLPFNQLHCISGRGLGLSSVQRLVALQGGNCGYEKLPGGDASFYFTLPGVS